MFRHLSLICVFLMLSFLAKGQEGFRVILSSGKNYKKTEKGFFELKNGTPLNKKDRIEVLPNGLVILMDSEGRLLEIELEGQYDMATLDLKELYPPSELIYTEWENFYNPKRNLEDWAPNHYVKEPSSFVDLHLNFPSSTEVYGRYIQLDWADIHDEYQVRFWSEYDKIFETHDVDSTHFNIDLLSGSLAFKDIFGVEVFAKNSKRSTGVYFLDKLSPPDKELLDQAFRTFPKEGTMLTDLTKAIMLENRGLFADAATAYKVLIAKYGNRMIPFYQSYLDRFGF
ncbi:hypothetical protein [Roseivirga sp.]|uniref:hypothetical protein n=1 Tax=Roseivirga sp. TaxID=1964215 RepID=UPI002B2727CC|nr:hypothetical protein [Roseivirga sp.]